MILSLIHISIKEEGSTKHYYVYVKGNVVLATDDVTEAVTAANDSMGVVIGDNLQYCLLYTSGTINGVLIGIILSFSEMIIRTAKPARCFLGIQPGHRHFRDLKEGSQIHAVEGVLIYRFSSNLFFANIQVLKQDIEDHVTDQTRAVILDASGIGSMDITAADGLGMLYQSLKEKGVRFYMTDVYKRQA